jgi:hypothetical protein
MVDGYSPSLDLFFEVLWQTDFIFDLADDVNRCEDGKVLRRYFYAETASADLGLVGPCSVLEVLIGLAKRLNELAYDPEYPNRIGYWFWELVTNLGFDREELGNLEILGVSELEMLLARFMARNFQKDGSEGGLFPVSNPTCNQNVLPLWQQLQHYLMENY